MSKSTKLRAKTKIVDSDYALLDNLISLDDIPDLGVRILKNLGKGNIKVSSAEKMLSLLTYLEKLASSTINRVSLQKYRMICEAADQLHNNKILEIAKFEHEKVLDFDEDDIDVID